MRRLAFLATLLVAAPALVGTATARAQDPAVERGVQFLRQRAPSLPPGEAALAGLALVKAGVPTDDPGLAACLERVERCFPSSSYAPVLSGPAGLSIYEAAVITLLYVNLDPVAYRGRIESTA